MHSLVFGQTLKGTLVRLDTAAFLLSFLLCCFVELPSLCCFVFIYFETKCYSVAQAGMQWCFHGSLQPLPHCSLCPIGSSNSPSPAFWVAEITGAPPLCSANFCICDRDRILPFWLGWSRTPGLKLLPPQPPYALGLQAWATVPSPFVNILQRMSTHILCPFLIFKSDCLLIVEVSCTLNTKSLSNVICRHSTLWVVFSLSWWCPLKQF